MAYNPLNYVPDYSYIEKIGGNIQNVIEKVPGFIDAQKEFEAGNITKESLYDEAVKTLNEYSIPVPEDLAPKKFETPTQYMNRMAPTLAGEVKRFKSGELSDVQNITIPGSEQMSSEELGSFMGQYKSPEARSELGRVIGQRQTSEQQMQAAEQQRQQTQEFAAGLPEETTSQDFTQKYMETFGNFPKEAQKAAENFNAMTGVDELDELIKKQKLANETLRAGLIKAQTAAKQTGSNIDLQEQQDKALKETKESLYKIQTAINAKQKTLDNLDENVMLGMAKPEDRAKLESEIKILKEYSKREMNALKEAPKILKYLTMREAYLNQPEQEELIDTLKTINKEAAKTNGGGAWGMFQSIGEFVLKKFEGNKPITGTNETNEDVVNSVYGE